MVVAIATWSLVIAPGKKVTHEVIRDFKITNAALGAQLEDDKARSTLKVSYEPPPLSDGDEEDDVPKKSPSKKTKKTEIALCSLTPGTIEQAALDITFLEEDAVEFEVIGKNSIHLFGNYIDQTLFPNDLDPDMNSSDEESVDLRDVSSDVEINPDELEGLDDSDDEDRFEEIDETPAAGKKHARESDAMDADTSVNLSTSAKKSNKKLKAESGSAVPVTMNTDGDAKPESKKEKKKKEKKNKAEGKSDTESGEAKEQKSGGTLKELGGGLKIKDVKVGSGKQAKAGNNVLMRYIGKLPNGSVFDSNTKGKPFTFRLGKGEVIKGWDQGIAGMHVGGERLLIVPPALGYGNKSQKGIPAGSTLHFECKLVDIK
ncbi:hypothetical protein K439DRAFT_1384157 [Ramaria rubella]|nr:hypothetical protein K439DRAFT_1384157 [Ramaria rubella]